MMKMKSIRNYLLVSEMLGVEGSVTAELALMIINLQALGLSVALTSIPIMASATTSLVLIPLLGYINKRCAKTAKQKALSLITVNILQITGASLIILANLLKLYDGYYNTDATNTTAIVSDSFPKKSNYTNIISTTINHQAIESAVSIALDTFQNVSTQPSTQPMENANVHGDPSSSTQPMENANVHGDPSSSGQLKPYAIIAILGYIMNDSGYDTGSCFLKTFALSCTPPEDHPKLIVKAVQISSLGGILVTLLVALGVGEMLASGTDLNVNSLTVVFMFGLMLVLLVPTMIATLTTGLCWVGGVQQGGDEYKDEDEEDVDVGTRSKYEETRNEKQRLIRDSIISSSSGLEDRSISSIRNDDPNNNNNNSTQSTTRRRTTSNANSNREVIETIWQLSQSGAHSLVEEALNCGRQQQQQRQSAENTANGFVEFTNKSSSRRGCLGTLRRFFKQQEKRLILCIASFFAFAALFSFNIYSVNFVTVSIFDGDANAPPNSQKYENYLKGVKVGSTGLLIFYTSFVVGTTLQDLLLPKIGWWKICVITFPVYITCNLTSALAKLEWIYYISSFVNGFYRAMVFTMPYILACRIMTDDSSDSGKERSGDISLVSAMLPLSMTMCSAILGPMIELTGNATTPIFFSAVSATIGLSLFSLLRKY